MPETPSLSTAATSFIRSHIYQNNAPAAHVLSDVPAIRFVGRQLRGRKSMWGWVCLACFGLALVSFLLAVIAEVPLAIPLIFIFVAGGIALAIVYSKIKTFDDAEIDTLEQVTRLLSTDMAPEAPLAVNLDLRPHDHADKFDHDGEAGLWKVKFYIDPWLVLGGRLLDGTSFNLHMTTRYQARKRTKRTASGKTKTKTKSKQSVRALLRLRVKPGKFRHLSTLAADAAKAVQLPEQAVVRDLSVEPDSLSLSVDAPDAAPSKATASERGFHQLAAMMFLSLYEVLNLSRAIDKSQPSGGNP